jgi:hypothetical protein
MHVLADMGQHLLPTYWQVRWFAVPGPGLLSPILESGILGICPPAEDAAAVMQWTPLAGGWDANLPHQVEAAYDRDSGEGRGRCSLGVVQACN